MPDKIWFLIASDILINLAAGWLGAILIVPNYSKKRGFKKYVLLTMDVVFAIFCILGAYKFRIM